MDENTKSPVPEKMEKTLIAFRGALADMDRMEKDAHWDEQRVEVPLNVYNDMYMECNVLRSMPRLLMGCKYDCEKVTVITRLLELLGLMETDTNPGDSDAPEA